jgi:phosphate transport system substrate-binding protein
LPLSSRHIEVGTTDLVAAEVQSNPGAIGYVDRGTATRLQLNTTQLDGTEASPENVESNTYHFWAIEHMYTKDIHSGLTATFLQYMTKNDAQVVINALNYVSYNLMSSEAKAAHQKL